MSIVLVETPGDPAANTYCGLATANTIASAEFPRPDVWLKCHEHEQAGALCAVTREIDQFEAWMEGVRASTTQVLAYPRKGAPGPSGLHFEDDELYPGRVVRATAVGAFTLVKLFKADPSIDPLAPSQYAGLQSVSTPELTVTMAARGGGITAWQRTVSTVLRPILGNLLRAPQRSMRRG